MNYRLSTTAVKLCMIFGKIELHFWNIPNNWLKVSRSSQWCRHETEEKSSPQSGGIPV